MIVLFNPVEHAVAEEAAADVAAGASARCSKASSTTAIVDGNIEADAAGAIIAIADKTPHHRDRRDRDAGTATARRRVGLPAVEARAAGRADHLGRLLSLAARRCVPERSDRRHLRDRPGRADDPSS